VGIEENSIYGNTKTTYSDTDTRYPIKYPIKYLILKTRILKFYGESYFFNNALMFFLFRRGNDKKFLVSKKLIIYNY